MPGVRGLEWYLRNAGLIKKADLSVLRGATLGVDGLAYLRHRDCVVDASEFHCGDARYTGLCLHEQLEVLLEHFSPVFVFPGCALRAPSDRAVQRIVHDSFTGERWQAWQAASSRKFKSAASMFKEECTRGLVSAEKQATLWGLVRALQAGVDAKAAHAQNNSSTSIHAMRAVTNVVSKQLQQLWTEKYIHSVYGGVELLILGIDRVVLSIDHDEETCEFVVLADVLEKLGFTFPQFVDLCLLAGHGNPSFPPAIVMRGRFKMKTPQFQFQKVIEAIQTHETAAQAIAHYVEDPRLVECDFESEFKRAKARVNDKTGVYEQASGTIVTPTDTHPDADQLADVLSFFSSSSSSAVVQLLVKGVLSPLLLGSAVHRVAVDTAPLVDSQNYSLLLEKLATLRVRAAEDVQRALFNGQAQGVTRRMYYNPQHSQSVPVSEVKETQAVAGGLGEDTVGAVSSRVYGAWGIADSLDALRGAVQAPQESLAVLCVLLAHGAVTGDALELVNPTSDQLEVLRIPVTDVSTSRSIRLISRVCSLLPRAADVDCNEAWGGPVDHETSAFVCMQRLVCRELGLAMQAGLVRCVAGSEGEVDLSELDRVTAALPFITTTQVDTMGVLMKEYLVPTQPQITPSTTAPTLNGELDSKDPDQQPSSPHLKQLEALFPQVVDVRTSLTALISFYTSVSEYVRAKHVELAPVFESADRFLAAHNKTYM